MARIPAEMDRPGGDLAPQSQSSPTALDRNGFYTPGGLPPRAQRRQPNPLHGLILPLVVATVCGAGAFYVANYHMTRWYTSATTIVFPASSSQNGMLTSLLGGGASAPPSIPLIGPYSSPQYNDVNSAIMVLDSGRAKGEVMNRLHLAGRWHLPPDQAGARFNKNVTYLVDKNGSLVVQANDTNPRLAQQIVNAYVQAMRDVSTELSTTRAHQNVVALQQRYKVAQQKMALHENALVALQRRMAQTMPLGSTVAGSYAELVNQQTAARTDLNATNAAIKAQLQTAQKTYGHGLNLPTSVAFSNSTIQALRAAQANFDKVSAEFGPAYPGYREAQDQLTQARQQAQQEIQRQYSATTQFISPEMRDLYVKRATAQATLDNLNQVAADRRTAMLSLPDAQRREADLNRLISLDNATNTTLAQAVTQAELVERRDVPTFMTIDPAGIPGDPSLPRVGYVTALAAVAGFLLTLAWLAARALWGQPTSQEQMRRWTDAYGLTERDAAPSALGAEAQAVLPDRTAPQLPLANGVNAAASASETPEMAMTEIEPLAGSRRP